MSDTHVPARARDLPPALWAAVDAADVVFHAGDWVNVSLLDRLDRPVPPPGGLSTATTTDRRCEPGCRGSTRWCWRTCAFAVIHETGPAAGREARCAARFADVDVLVFGHSHIPWDTVAASGLRLLNPARPPTAAASRTRPT